MLIEGIIKREKVHIDTYLNKPKQRPMLEPISFISYIDKHAFSNKQDYNTSIFPLIAILPLFLLFIRIALEYNGFDVWWQPLQVNRFEEHTSRVMTFFPWSYAGTRHLYLIIFFIPKNGDIISNGN